MKLEKLVFGSGAALGVFVLVAAVISDDAIDHPDFDGSGKLIAEAVGAGAGVGTPGLNAPQMPADLPRGGQMQAAALPGVPTMIPMPQGAGIAPPGAISQGAIPGLVPFSRPAQERFSGRVTQVTALGADAGWGQVHITITDDITGASRIVSLAPTWYLQYLGCGVMQNYQVSGQAFRFDAPAADVPLYARTIKVNGRPCQLRSDEGFALWSSKLGNRQ